MLCSYDFLSSFKIQAMATVALYEHCSYYFLISELINSSNWQCFCIKALCQVLHRKHTIGNGQNSGGREALKSKGKGTRREALLGGDKIEWYWDQPPWTGVLVVSGGEAHIPPVTRNYGEAGGVAIPGGVQIRCDRGSTPQSGHFSRPVSKG